MALSRRLVSTKSVRDAISLNTAVGIRSKDFHISTSPIPIRIRIMALDASELRNRHLSGFLGLFRGLCVGLDVAALNQKLPKFLNEGIH